jgi:hypothetical protein
VAVLQGLDFKFRHWRVSGGFAAACAIACSHGQGRWIQPLQDAHRPKALYLDFAGTNASGFVNPDGKACPPSKGTHASWSMLGWKSDDRELPACTHDTLYDGQQPAALELSWSGQVPGDGDYELNTFGYTVSTTGQVVCRGTWHADTHAAASLVIEANSAHCSQSWSLPLAAVSSFGPESRAVPFYGYKEIPPLLLPGCKAGEALRVRARLVGEVNRGRVDVDSFGFFPGSYSDAHQLFGLVLRNAPPLGGTLKR